MNIGIYIVFHKTLDERLIFQNLSEEETYNIFKLYAVNKSHQNKSIIRRNGIASDITESSKNIIREFDLDWHDSTLQERGFLEGSCYIHLLKNELYKKHHYIGVTQYDMQWTQPSVDILHNLAAAPKGDDRTVYGMISAIFMNEAGIFHQAAAANVMDWDFVLKSYNKFFCQNWDFTMFVNKPLTLFQTYILPQPIFAELAQWLETLCAELYPWANQPPHATHWGHLAGYLERAEALFIAAALAEGRITLRHLPLLHDGSIHHQLGVNKDHYQ